jgi:hypothetical protein
VSVTGQRWRERIIISPSDLLQLKTKPQQINLVALFFTMVISYIKEGLYILKCRAIRTEKVWLLFVNITQKLRGQYKCVSCHIFRWGTTQLSKLAQSCQNQDVCDP